MRRLSLSLIVLMAPVMAEGVPPEWLKTKTLMFSAPLTDAGCAAGAVTRADVGAYESPLGSYASCAAGAGRQRAEAGLVIDGTTNLLLRSDAIQAAPWATACTAGTLTVTGTVAGVTTPDGTTGTATRLDYPVVNNGFYCVRTQSFTATAAPYSASIYASSVSGTALLWLMDYKSLATFTSRPCRVPAYPAWTRCEVPNATMDVNSWTVAVGTDTRDSSTFGGEGQQFGNSATSIYLWRGSVTQSDAVREPCGPTAAGSLLCATDAKSVPDPLSNGSAFTLAATVTPEGPGRIWTTFGANRWMLALGDSTGANTAHLYVNSSGAPVFTVYDSTGTALTVTGSALIPGQHRLEGRANNGTLTLLVDSYATGSTSGTGTGIISALPANMWIGSVNGSSPFYGSIRDVAALRNARAAPAVRQVAFMGDSIPTGMVVTTPPSTMLSQSLGSSWYITNGGVGGYTTTQILSVWTNTVRATHPAIVIVEGGVNDAIADVPAATAFANLKTIYDQAIADGARVVALTVLPWKGYASWTSGRQAITDAINTSIKAYNGGPNFTVFDTYALMGDSDPQAMLAAYVSRDKIHPNQFGSDYWAAQLYAAEHTAGWW